MTGILDFDVFQAAVAAELEERRGEFEAPENEAAEELARTHIGEMIRQ